MLRFSKEQMAGLGEDRLAASHQKIARMLRENAPEDTAPLDDAALLALAQRSDAAGRNLGIRTERGHLFWAFLMLTTDERASQLPEVRAVFAMGKDTPDEVARILVERLAADDQSANPRGR